MAVPPPRAAIVGNRVRNIDGRRTGGPGGWSRTGFDLVQFVQLNTTNHGIAIAAGHDLAMSGNRVVSGGRLPDGNPLAAQNVGVYVWNAYGLPDFAGYVAAGNVVGWSQPAAGRRNDWWLPDCVGCAGNVALKGASAITLADEAAEWPPGDRRSLRPGSG